MNLENRREEKVKRRLGFSLIIDGKRENEWPAPSIPSLCFILRLHRKMDEKRLIDCSMIALSQFEAASFQTPARFNRVEVRRQ